MGRRKKRGHGQDLGDEGGGQETPFTKTSRRGGKRKKSFPWWNRLVCASNRKKKMGARLWTSDQTQKMAKAFSSISFGSGKKKSGGRDTFARFSRKGLEAVLNSCMEYKEKKESGIKPY